MKKFWQGWLLLVLANTVQAQVEIANLRCEMLENPAGIDKLDPRLSWNLSSPLRNVEQTAYQVWVAADEKDLDNNKKLIWNSGKVNSSHSLHISYKGKPLQAGKKYYWKVMAYTNKGASTWSKPAYWVMGLLQKTDWKAKWIGYDKASPWDSMTKWSRLSARYLRKEFKTETGIKRATVFLSGMGLYELYVNGQRIGEQVLAPNPTDYRKTVLYNVHDVTSQLKGGENVIATILGNGRFFTMRQNYKPQKHNTFGFPKLLLQLEIEYNNGSRKTIISDESWKLNADGPIRTNNEYDGEEYDATKEFPGWSNPGYNDAAWMKAELTTAPEGVLKAQLSEPMKVMQTIKPVAISSPGYGKFILDMGQNFAGWLRLRVKGNRGQKVVLRFAESLQTNEEIFTSNLRDAKVTDVYTLKGEGVESWEPSFVYHGFRYVEITGYPGIPTVDDFDGRLVYDGMATTGNFYSSNSLLNRIHKNAWWGIASNYKGMPVDCPQRNERQPWLGDRAVGSQGESYLFNNAKLYAKWLDDIEESQREDGAIPDVAPAFWNYYSDNITWPGAYILVANMLYNQFGDKESIVKHYPSMKKWVDYMRSKYMKDGLMTKDKYGDWCVPPESGELIHSKDPARQTDGVLIATAYYHRMLFYLQRFAKLLDKTDDARAYETLMKEMAAAFNKKFYNPTTRQYGNNSVTSNLLPLYFGLAPDSARLQIFESIRKKIHVENHDHISTGLIGTQWLMRGLTEFGYADLAFALAVNETYPGWGYMIKNDATTIWELWNGNTANPGMNSQNHVMLLGDLLIWYYENLAGIRTDKTSVGFKKIIMKPVLIAGLDTVMASYQSPYGQIKSQIIQSRDQLQWDIRVPANTRAMVYFPLPEGAVLTENGKSLEGMEGVNFIKKENNSLVYEIGSGDYSFTGHYRWRAGILNDEFIFTHASFPESHAATIAETPEGLIASWFGGTKEGNKDVCIWTSRLVNDQWSDPLKVADGVINDSTRYPCYNPVLYQVPGGELLLFYKIGPNVAGWTGWMIRSKDHGKTWSKREALPEGYLGPIKNKPVLINGTLICPSSTEKNGWKVHFEMTSDAGRSWTKTGPINDGKIISAIQPSLLIYPDGRLQVLCRSRNRTINESWSHDGGKTWSGMKATLLPNNNSGTDAVTLKDGRQLLVYNHVKPAPELPNGKGARTPLNVALSNDGINWSAALVLEHSPVSQYSYPSVIQGSDGMVHIVYTWRRERIKYVKVDPSKLETISIQNERWPGMLTVVAEPSED